MEITNVGYLTIVYLLLTEVEEILVGPSSGQSTRYCTVRIIRSGPGTGNCGGQTTSREEGHPSG